MKVDDTPMGMEAARNAGCWAVGLSASGNALGVSAAEWAEMSDANRVSALRPIESTFREAGADFVIPTAADLPAVLSRSPPVSPPTTDVLTQSIVATHHGATMAPAVIERTRPPRSKPGRAGVSISPH